MLPVFTASHEVRSVNPLAVRGGSQEFLRWCLATLRCGPEEFGPLVGGREVGGADESFDFGKLTGESRSTRCN